MATNFQNKKPGPKTGGFSLPKGEKTLKTKGAFVSSRNSLPAGTGRKSLSKNLRVGDVCELKISALGANNIGIDEFSYPYAVFVPNAKYGSVVKAKVLKMTKSASWKSAPFPKGTGGNLPTAKTMYAVAQMLEEIKQADNSNPLPVKAGDVLTVSIEKEMSYGKGSPAGSSGNLPGDPSIYLPGTKTNRAGVVDISPKFQLIIPLSVAFPTFGTEEGTQKNVKVLVTRVKENYAFAKVVESSFKKKSTGPKEVGGTSLPPFGNVSTAKGSEAGTSLTNLNSSALGSKLTFASKFTTTLPKNCQKYGKYVILKIKDSVLFVKVQKGVNLGDKVRIKVTSSSNNCAIGKVLQVNPMSQNQKTALVLNSVRDMINHGLHFGQKAVRCHARMKNYIWLKKQSSTVGTVGGKFPPALFSKKANFSVAGSSGNGGVTSLDKTGRPLIKKGRHVINLLKTRRCLNKALNTLTKYALKDRTFLFIGTKKPATGLVARASFFTKNSFYVNTRWLGGMLTNWNTICKSISKIRPILKEKQKVVRDILQRRQNIKSRLIKNALLLRKKSKLILTKGRTLLNIFKNNNNTTKNEMMARAEKLIALRQDFIQKGMDYIQKRHKLIQKRRELIYQTLLLKEKGLQISAKYKSVLTQLTAYTKKLREYKYLLILTNEIKALKSLSSLGQNQKVYAFSYGKLKEVSQNESWIIQNPPKEILNRIILTMKKKYENDSLIQAKTEMGGVGNSPAAGRPTAAKLPASSTEKQIIVCSTLLDQFSSFSPYIKSVITNLITSIQSLEAVAQTYRDELNKIKSTLVTYVGLKNKYVSELQLLNSKLTNERQIIRIVKPKLKALDAQKKLIKFLPRLRYLPTPQSKISQIVQILLSKIVEPKLKYPIDNIYEQKLSTNSKKLAAARKKKWQRLEKYFGGIANMTKLTKTNISRNVAIIIGQRKEMNAVRECQKLGIKTFTIVDTNCNPTLADHIIPANDDSRNAIKYILTKFITRIRLAQKLRARLQKLQKN